MIEYDQVFFGQEYIIKKCKINASFDEYRKIINVT